MIRICTTLAIIGAFTTTACAHHNRTLYAFVRAVKARDFELIRPIWSDDAWKGANDGISVETLDRWLDEADTAEFKHASGHEINLQRLVMAFKFTHSSDEIPEWVYLLLKPAPEKIFMRINGEAFPCKWKVARLTTDASEAERFHEHGLRHLNSVYGTVPVPKRGETKSTSDKLPEGDNGIAAKYPGDKRIEQDRFVILADDFEGHSGIDGMRGKWDIVSQRGASIATQEPNVFLGRQSLELSIPKRDQEMALVAAKSLKEKRDVLFLRYYAKFNREFDVTGSSHNGSSISGGYYKNGRASAGEPADGRNKFLVGFENSRNREFPEFGNPGRYGLYIYHPEQRHRWGDRFFPTGMVLPNSSRRFDFGPSFVSRTDIVPELDRWYCHEIMVKANTPGERNGRVACWLDGRLIADFANLRLRDVDSLKIDHFHVGLHIGRNSNAEAKRWYDNVVAATSYIGPVKHTK